MNAMPFVIGALAILALAYRFYYSFIAAKVLTLNDNTEAPSIRLFSPLQSGTMENRLLKSRKLRSVHSVVQSHPLQF